MEYEISLESGISDFYYCEHSQTVDYPPHIHSHIEFVYVMNGTLDFHAYGQNLHLTQDNVAIITPYEIHSYHTVKDSDIFIIACPPEYIPEYRQIFTGKAFEPIFFKINHIHKSIIQNIISEEFKDNLKKKALIYCTLSDFMHSCTFSKKESFEYDLYRKAVIYITQNYTDEKLSLTQTAEHMGITPSHLSRVLNSNEKPGFTELVNTLRSYTAKQKLEQLNISIGQIAYDSGFGSIRNFNRIFKKIYGCTPYEYRKKQLS